MTVEGWIALVAGLSPAIASLCWQIWNLYCRPRMVPHDRVLQMAQALFTQHGIEALEHAATAEDRAWQRGDLFEQGLWYRIKLQLEAQPSHRLPTDLSHLELGHTDRIDGRYNH